jgi:hypothetical protein
MIEPPSRRPVRWHVAFLVSAAIAIS